MDVSKLGKLGWKASTTLEDGIRKAYNEYISRVLTHPKQPTHPSIRVYVLTSQYHLTANAGSFTWIVATLSFFTTVWGSG